MSVGKVGRYAELLMSSATEENLESAADPELVEEPAEDASPQNDADLTQNDSEEELTTSEDQGTSDVVEPTEEPIVEETAVEEETP